MNRSTEHRRSLTGRHAAAVLAVISIGATGCAEDRVVVGSPPAPVDGVASAAPGADPAVAGSSRPRPGDPSSPDEVLVTVPPVDERHPDLFDEHGCSVTRSLPAFDELTPDERERLLGVLSPADRAQLVEDGTLSAEALESAEVERVLESLRRTATDCPPPDEQPAHPLDFFGFNGPSAGSVAAGDIVTTEAAGTDGRWTAIGLIGTPDRGGIVEVTATLIDGEGTVVAQVTAESPVIGARPGEPVPFTIEADVPFGSVAEVDWSLRTRGRVTNRSTEIVVERVLRIDGSAWIIGGVRNPAPRPVRDPRGILGVVDTTGRLAALYEFDVTTPGTSEPIGMLREGWIGAFEVEVPADAVTEAGDNFDIWVVAS